MKKKCVISIISNVIIITLLGVLFCVTHINSGKYSDALAPIYRGDPEKKQVGIMINVYEGSEYVAEILKILDKYSVSCTFFVGGIWAQKNNALLKEMSYRAEIGNHGYLHLNHSKLSEEKNYEEIMLCHNLVKAVTSIEMNLFAPPSGDYGKETLKVCQDNNYKVIMWSKDTIDWRDKNPDTVTARATTDIQNGDLILMHPTKHTVSALPTIIEFYLDNGFNIVTVSEILK